jgi:Skp family chaperone for outer membrane proteins
VLNVNKLLLSSAVVAALFAVCIAGAGPASAQQPPAGQFGVPQAATAAPNIGIVLVDVNYIFKHHARLKSSLKELQAEGDAVQKGFEEKLRALQERSKQLGGPAGYKPGTPDYTHLEEQLVHEKSDIQTEIALKRKEFVQREAKLYFNAYREVTDEVTNFCQQRGIALAMNFNGDAIDPENPDTVARGIGSKYPFYNKGLDITPVILQRFAERPATADPRGGDPNNMTPR